MASYRIWEPTALGVMFKLLAISLIFTSITLFVRPAWALACIATWLLVLLLVLGYDSRHWGKPGPDTLGIFLTSKTRNLELGDYSLEGMVMGSCVKARNIFSAARAESRALVGGEALQFSSLVEECRNIALSRMCRQARKQGCNGIVGFRMITAETLFGATEIIAYGTAVRIRGLPE